MIDKLKKRRQLLVKLFPWDEPNYGIDEQWARIYPYGQNIKPGQNAEISVKIFNHSNYSHIFTVSLNVPKGFRLKPERASINIQSKKEGETRFEIAVPDNISEKVYVITSDIKFDKWNLRHWSEAIMEVSP